jgi:hypothetical protein
MTEPTPPENPGLQLPDERGRWPLWARYRQGKDEFSGNKKLAGLALGIGSAAIVAALLFAGRARKDDRGS